MRVLVTGGAGFIGSHVVDRLLALGHEVTVVDDLSTGKLANLAAARADRARPVRFQRLDITSDALEPAFARAEPEVVVHLAAQMDVRASVADPVRDAMVNVVGTVNVLECARRHGARKIVMATSGGCVYGEPPPEAMPVAEDYEGTPHSPYGTGKKAVEEYLRHYAVMHGLAWSALAFGNVYGPRQDPSGEAGVVAIFAALLLEDRPVTIFGDGTQTRDFVYVDDVVDACCAALDSGDGLRLNIGTGDATSVLALHAELARQTGSGHRPRHAPARSGELEHIALDCSRAAAALGWSPRTPFAEGLARTLAWVRA